MLPSGVRQANVGGNFAMGSMTAALPVYRQSQPNYGMPSSAPKYSSSPSGVMAHQLQQIPQFAGQMGMSNTGHNHDFSSQFGQHYPPAQQGGMPSPTYLMQASGTQHRGGIRSPAHQGFAGGSDGYFPGHQQAQQPYTFYPPAYGQASPMQYNSQGRFRPFFPSQRRRLNPFYYQGPHRIPEATFGGLGGQFPLSTSPNAQIFSSYNPMGAMQRPGGNPGKWLPFEPFWDASLIGHVRNCREQDKHHCDIRRDTICTTRSSTKTQAVRICALGG